MKKYITLLLIVLLFIPVYFLQGSFSKTNPYDPNWIYGEDTLSMNPNYYKATKDK